MLIFKLLVLCLGAVAAVPGSSPQRIVGGSVTTISEYTYIAALLSTNNWSTWSQACGSIILNNRAILSAAHCIDGDAARRWRVRVGSTYANSGGTVHQVQYYNTHPQYNSQSFDNDIVLIRTSTSITYLSSAVQPASIAGFNYTIADGEDVFAAGWGATSVIGSNSDTLRQVQLQTINQNTCATLYGLLGFNVTENMLCSGPGSLKAAGQCQGDNGGPLYHNGLVVGIISWGFQCAQSFFPGVNTRVSQFSNWIYANS